MAASLRYSTLKWMRRITPGLVTVITVLTLSPRSAVADDGGNPQRDFQTTKPVNTSAGSGTITTSADRNGFTAELSVASPSRQWRDPFGPTDSDTATQPGSSGSDGRPPRLVPGSRSALPPVLPGTSLPSFETIRPSVA